MGTLWQDVRYGCRMLARNPGFATAVVVILAVGIGANTVFFSIINSVLFRPLPFEEPDELVMVYQNNPQQGWTTVSPGAFAQWRKRSTAFEHMVAHHDQRFTLTGSGVAEIVAGACVSPGFFETLGVRPAMGRAFLREEEEAGSNNVAVLSYGLWRRRFGADPNVLGKTLIVNGTGVSIIGVLPREFSYPCLRDAELWVPLVVTEHDRANYGGHWLQVVARLKDGVTMEQADAQMNGIALQIVQEFPEGNRGLTAVFLCGLHELVVAGTDKYLFALFGATACVLLIACANVAGLLLARLPGRQKELAVRVAMGAQSSRIARQLLTESSLLAVLAGTFGFLLSIWGVQLARGWILTGFPLVERVGIDARVLAFTAAVSILTGLLLGLAPLLQLGRGALTEFLKEETTRVMGGARACRLRAALIVFEVALAVVLLIGGGVMIRSLMKLAGVAPGFRSDHLLTVGVHLPPYGSAQPPPAFFEQLLPRVQRLPSVQSAAVVSYLPTQYASRYSAVDEETAAQDGEGPQAAYRAVSPSYFDTMGIPLLKGRDFSEQDIEGRPYVAIVNERLARTCWPDQDPIGRRLKPGGPRSEHPWLTVVGVVASTNDPLNHGYNLEMYRPLAQFSKTAMTLVVRTKGDPMALARAVRTQIADLDPDVPVSRITTMKRLLWGNLSLYRFITMLPAVFAATALLLAIVGLYGMMSYLVSQRTREIGIRMALGAGVGAVLRMVIGEGMKLALIGLLLGLGAALVAVRILARYLYEVSPRDPATFVVVALLLTTAAFAACYLPARRAARIDPMVALRYE